VARALERKPGAKVDPNAPRDQEGVYLMENGKTRFQPITTGMIGELSIEVVSGLKGGETLITGPFKALRELEPGGAVKVEDPNKKKLAGDAAGNNG
jgi:HlyD family secretion protein